MKIWLKLLVGCLLGTILGILLPAQDELAMSVLSAISSFAIGLGRYILLPLTLFSLPVAAYELHSDGRLGKTLGKGILYAFLSSIAATVLGLAAALVLTPGRIPLLAASGSAPALLDMSHLALSIFPANALEAIVGSGDFLLPLCAFCVVLGLAMCFDRIVAKPAIALFDSLSRIFYHVNSFIAEFLGILVILIALFGVVQMKKAFEAEAYRRLLLSLSLETLIAAFAIIPLIVFLSCGRKNPYKPLFALLGPALASLASGDIYFSLGLMQKHAKESMGIKRRAGALLLPLTSIFGRAGTALIASTGFFVILNSYSTLGLGLDDLLKLIVLIPLLSLSLGAAPSSGAMSMLALIASSYGKGFESGALILVPVAFPLIALGALLDTVWAGALSYILANRAQLVEERELRYFI